ncbi:MAG TPA: SH3 domain-containing protein [Anaerolineae bacterium]|nr:SH3 domain-containing protein [Anaerolineae bacterium]
MTGKVGDTSIRSKSDDKYRKQMVIKYSTAWFLLLIIVTVVWRMSQPVRIQRMGEVGGSEASATAGGASSTASGTTITGTAGTRQLTLPSGKNSVQVMVEALNLRSGPSMRSNVIRRLTRGTIVKVESREGKWLRVRTVFNEVGYISSDPKLIREVP